jgi:hypothetical protein
MVRRGTFGADRIAGTISVDPGNTHNEYPHASHGLFKIVPQMPGLQAKTI